MHEIEEKTKNICELAKKLLCDTKPYIERGVWCDEVKGEGVGQVIDMIKDLAETEEKYWKAEYYKCLLKELKEREEDPRYGEPAGYNNRRYASGRYAPSGRGHISGFVPNMHTMDSELSRMMGDVRHEMMPVGYSDDYQRTHSSNYDNPSSRRGMTYDNYKNAKRYYTETKSPEHKEHMEEKAMEYVQDTIESVLEVWKEADPELKKKIKMDFTAAFNKMS